MSIVKKFNQLVDLPELAKLILRVGFSVLFLLHGVHKLKTGVDFVAMKFMEFGLPASFAYLAYLAEVVAPVLMILGVYTRIAAFIAASGSVVIMILMYSASLFTLTKVGSWTAEGIATFLFAFVAVMLLGSGKYALKAD
ncbi:DoxX subfamily protein [Aggregatibacter actinomycetemcomitans]|uniref:DoxX family protein n=1 Tax=Aggregatibacter actinomycetemcomitans TaxID=714 RepID=A0A5D0EL34_AGGAC|nr:DoxX family protein [Aggregatibacter actinomycetemcomitans]AFI88124.1 DoxX subfamily protein [Aggregatibacter actinomycetemcomitans D7S-1]KYK93743.1 GntR family transcriptional regulator [Aggregatibacter actinomycetemcomitans serotype d str. SA3733]AMQ95044.1 DoxX subfamily protein [Aggregatibacter actinomycetemcomitans]ANU82421.1 DoxX subfamily protein [Aggregatibacter actinomycetemcomitans]EKX94544.1 DoxX family protein [Aggregatibacter actinomycetemcomitans Y4]